MDINMILEIQHAGVHQNILSDLNGQFFICHIILVGEWSHDR